MKTVKSAKLSNGSTNRELEPSDILSLIRRGGRSFLLSLKQKSMRVNNSWYRVLAVAKRRFIDAVIQTVDKVNSSLVLKILSPLVRKLLQAIGGVGGLMGQLSFSMLYFGQSLAQRTSAIAKKWGNDLALAWASDSGFIRYLSVLDMNNLSLFKR